MKRIGQFKILRTLSDEGVTRVYEALDDVQGIRVALKVPGPGFDDPESLTTFRREARIAAKLDHPNILPVLYAGKIDGRFVLVHRMGKETLADRLGRRTSDARKRAFAEQFLAALAHAHGLKVAHLDIKPENVILFEGERLRLADFGLARTISRTHSGSGSGTVGYCAPEQAMGKPSIRSDVFSAGLVLYELFTGVQLDWPFRRPFPKESLVAKMAGGPAVLKALELEPRLRFIDAGRFLAAFREKNGVSSRLKKRRKTPTISSLLHKEFKRRYRKTLKTAHDCRACAGPVSEEMLCCPWCGKSNKPETAAPLSCRRCGRWRKSDWTYCAWCHGPAFKTVSERTYPDKRYIAKCSGCKEERLPEFARYCPDCKTKRRRPWPIGKDDAKCRKCRCGVADGLWSWCPWCAARIKS